MTRALVIAEIGVNHNGCRDIATKLIDESKKAGADIVKFQTFSTSALVTKDADMAQYQKLKSSQNSTQYKMLKELELDFDTFKYLSDYCQKLNIGFMSTAFDDESFEFIVNELPLFALKIPSGEINNAPFILKHAQTGMNIIMSTGMCDLNDIREALGVLAYGYLCPKNTVPSSHKFGEFFESSEGMRTLKEKLTILHCTSAYPTPINDVNLAAMKNIHDSFGISVGYSDHTEGIETSVIAVTHGAKIIEKHITLDKKMKGPDHSASLEPDMFQKMIRKIRRAEKIMGSSTKYITESEKSNRLVARKSLTASKRIKKGELFTEENIAIKRPGSGIDPKYYWDFINKKALRNYNYDELIDDE